MIQSTITTPDAEFTTSYNIQKVKFSLESYPKEMLHRASLEIYVLMGTLTKVADDYVSQEQELEYQKELAQSNPKELCKYLLAKIYQWARIMHKVHINSMFGTFFSNGSRFFLTDCKIIQLEIQNPEMMDKLKKGMPKKVNEAQSNPIFNTKMIEIQRLKQKKKEEDLKKRREKNFEKEILMRNEETSLQKFRVVLQGQIGQYKSLRRSELYKSYDPQKENKALYRTGAPEDYSNEKIEVMKGVGKRSKSVGMRERLKKRLRAKTGFSSKERDVSYFGVQGTKAEHLLGIRKAIHPKSRFDRKFGGLMNPYFGEYFKEEEKIRKTYQIFKKKEKASKIQTPQKR